jgi:hypothetical protein
MCRATARRGTGGRRNTPGRACVTGRRPSPLGASRTSLRRRRAYCPPTWRAGTASSWAAAPYVSAWLARRGLRPAGLDNSAAQLATARQLQDRFGLRFPLIPLIVRCARPADLRRQASTAFPPCGGKAAANPVIRELRPCCLRRPGPLSRHAGAPGRWCLARRLPSPGRLAVRDGGGSSGRAATASRPAWTAA